MHIAAHQGNLECLKVFAGLENAVEIFKMQDKVSADRVIPTILRVSYRGGGGGGGGGLEFPPPPPPPQKS